MAERPCKAEAIAQLSMFKDPKMTMAMTCQASEHTDCLLDAKLSPKHNSGMPDPSR